MDPIELLSKKYSQHLQPQEGAGVVPPPAAPPAQSAAPLPAQAGAAAESPPSGPTPEAPTSGESGPGLISRFLMGAIDNLPAAGYMVARTLNPAVDGVIASASKPAESGAEAFGQTTADRATLGLVDQLAQGQAQLGALLSGEGQEAANDAGMLAKETVNNNLAAAREDYKWAALGGDVVGSLMVGGPALKAATAIPGIGKSVFFSTAAAAGGEAAVYRMNSDGTLEEVVTDAGTAALLGGIGAKLFQGGGALYRTLFGRSNKTFQREIGAEIFRAAEARLSKETGQAVTPAQVAQMLNDNPDKVLTDVFGTKGLLSRLQTLANSGDDQARNKVLGILRARNDMQFNFRDELLKVIKGDDFMTEQQAMKVLRSAQDDLKPRYDDLFDRMDAARWSQNKTQVKDAITKLFDPDQANTGGDIADVVRIINSAGGGRPAMTFREVNEARKKLNELIFQRIQQNNNPNTTIKLPIGNLVKAQKYLKARLGTNSEFAELQATYGDLEAAKNAFEFGKNILRRTDLDGADAQMFLEGDKSALVTRMFGQGAKFGMYTAAKSPKNPATAFKEAKYDDLRAVIGDDAVDAMKANVDSILAKQATKEAISTAAEAPEKVAKTASKGQTLMDTMISSKMITQDTRGVAPMFAARRVLERAAGKKDVTPYGGELERMQRLAAEAFSDNATAAKAVQAYGSKDAASIAQYLGLATGVEGAGAGGAVGEGSAAMMDWLLNSYNNVTNQ